MRKMKVIVGVLGGVLWGIPPPSGSKCTLGATATTNNPSDERSGNVRTLTNIHQQDGLPLITITPPSLGDTAYLRYQPSNEPTNQPLRSAIRRPIQTFQLPDARRLGLRTSEEEAQSVRSTFSLCLNIKDASYDVPICTAGMKHGHHQCVGFITNILL